jgi:hypothetical protein
MDNIKICQGCTAADAEVCNLTPRECGRDKQVEIPDGMPCKHPGCLNHITHPCEGCGRIGGKKVESN